jgi:hypothetical protein
VDCPLQLEGGPRGPSRRHAGWDLLRCDEPYRLVIPCSPCGIGCGTTLIGNALAKAAYVCLEYWLIYLALEAWGRRYWPQTMITWSRVVAGKWTDPLVGRDLLFGTFFGMVYVALNSLYEYANLRIGVPGSGNFNLENLRGFRAFADRLAVQLSDEVSGSLTLLLTLFLVRAVLKKQWIVGNGLGGGLGGPPLFASQFH